MPLPTDLDIPYYFAIRATRTVCADYCIRFAGQLLQLLPGPQAPSLVAQTVTVHVVPEGDCYVYHGKRRIAHQPVVAPPARPVPPTDAALPTAQPSPPKRNAKQRAWLFGHH